MAHLQPAPQAYARRFLLILALSTAIFTIGMLLIAYQAEGASVDSSHSCSNVRISVLAGNTRDFTVWTGSDPAAGMRCDLPGGHTPTDINSGDSISLHCLESTGGAGAPGAPDANGIIIRAYADNTGFPDGATFLWSQTFSSCLTQQDFTKHCTADGTVGGAAQFGTVRLYVRAVRTTVVTYDDSSDSATDNMDSGQYGVYRCNPRPTLMIPANEPSGSLPWIGGDTYDARLTADSAPTTVGTNGNLRTNCYHRESTPATVTFTSSVATANALLEGGPDVWPTGCTLKHNATLTKSSSVSGWTGVGFAIWDQTTPITGVTFPSSTVATFTSHTLNRILTATASCTVTVNGITTTIGNRGDSFTVTSCSPWQDARATNVPNNQAARGWYNRATQWRATGDFPSTDGTFGTSGSFPTTIVSTTSATVTSGLGYHKTVETFSTTARTDTVLQNWGNTSGVLDVSATWHMDGLNISKSSLGANASSFTIGADQQFGRSKGLRDINNVLLSGKAVTCQRTKPDLTTETAVAMGNTDASGNSPEAEFQVIAPQGSWQLTCTATGSGNTGTYTITFFHVSPFTADTVLAVGWNVSFNPNGTYNANISAVMRGYDPALDSIALVFPDDPDDVEITVMIWNPADSTFSYRILDGIRMVRDDGTSAAYHVNLTLSELNATQGAYAFVRSNLTGRPFIGAEYYGTANSGNFTGNFTGTVTDMAALPPEITIPGAFLFLSLLGIAISFVSKENPLPSIAGVIVQVILGVMLFSQSETYFNQNGTNFREALYLLFLVALVGTAVRAFLLVRPKKQEEYVGDA